MRTAESIPKTKILPSPIWPVLAAPVMASMTFLPPVPLDLGDGHAVYPDRSQCIADLVELEWLDDGHDDFHWFDPRWPFSRVTLDRAVTIWL